MTEGISGAECTVTSAASDGHPERAACGRSDLAAEFDVAIVGGGLVGVPLALALSVLGLRVALLERQRPFVAPGHESPGESLDQRCTALSAGSVAWLQQHSLWSSLAENAQAIDAVHVSHKGRFGATRLSAEEQGVDALGYVVENRRVLRSLNTQLLASTVTLLSEREVVSIDESGGVRHVRHVSTAAGGEDAQSLTARLLIGVDGVNSSVRRLLGVDAQRHDYQQSAVLGAVQLETDHAAVAYERFTDSGPLALLPRPGRVMSFVECVSPADGLALAEADDAMYLEHVQRRFGQRLGRFIAVGPRTVVPLARVEADTQHASRALLLGNAARLLHPIAGQGYNLALRDVAALVRQLSRGRDDPGAPGELAAFARARRADQRRVVMLTDTLARTFRGDSAALSHLRALALVGLDTVAPLRRRFARAAMGEPG